MNRCCTVKLFLRHVHSLHLRLCLDLNQGNATLKQILDSDSTGFCVLAEQCELCGFAFDGVFHIIKCGQIKLKLLGPSVSTSCSAGFDLFPKLDIEPNVVHLFQNCLHSVGVFTRYRPTVSMSIGIFTVSMIYSAGPGRQCMKFTVRVQGSSVNLRQCRSGEALSMIYSVDLGSHRLGIYTVGPGRHCMVFGHKFTLWDLFCVATVSISYGRHLTLHYIGNGPYALESLFLGRNIRI